jgi:hypothetical protein
MSWDTTTPTGGEAISQGDDRIRELKTDVQTALRGNASEGTEAMFPGSDSDNPVFRYRGLKGSTAARPASGQYGLYFDTSRNALQRDNGTTYDDIGTMIPSGTVMVFYSAAAPTGWTAVAVNDKFLRVVTAGGSGGTTGGTIAASSSLAHSHTVNSHTHSVEAHDHIMSYASATNSATGAAVGGGDSDNTEQYVLGAGGSLLRHLRNRTQVDGAHTSGATAPGTDSQIGGAFAYADVVLATKD